MLRPGRSTYLEQLPRELERELSHYARNWVRVQLVDIGPNIQDDQPEATVLVHLQLANGDWIVHGMRNQKQRAGGIRRRASWLRTQPEAFAEDYGIAGANQGTVDAVSSKLMEAADLLERLGYEAEGRFV
jgi:hypothetical protein